MSRKQFLERVEARLKERKTQLKAIIEAELRALRGQGERTVGDAVDLAAEDEAHEVAGGLVELENEEYLLVNESLERLERGEYGVCEDCGKDIPVQRMQALPYTTTCVHCQRESEANRTPGKVGSGNWQFQDAVEDAGFPPVEIAYEHVA